MTAGAMDDRSSASTSCGPMASAGKRATPQSNPYPANPAGELCGFTLELRGFTQELCGFIQELCGFSRELCGLTQELCGFTRELYGLTHVRRH